MSRHPPHSLAACPLRGRVIAPPRAVPDILAAACPGRSAAAARPGAGAPEQNGHPGRSVNPFTWYMTGRAGYVGVSDISRIVIPHACGLLVSASVLALIKVSLHVSSPIELGGVLIVTYAINSAVLMLFRSKRLLMIQALKAAYRGMMLRSTSSTGRPSCRKPPDDSSPS